MTPRFVIALLLIVLGHRLDRLLLRRRARRPDRDSRRRRPAARVHGRPDGWNYLIGFGVFFLGLMVSAHPSTPLGRGRGVVVGMLGCFLLGLLWICTYYVFSDDVSRLPIFDDLANYNLVVGIAFMAVGFTFATKWE